MSLLSESRITLKLALPLVIGQVSQMLLGVADTVMLGKLGVTELAVLTFTNSLFYLPFVFGIGLLTSTSVFTSNARGARDPAAGRRSCRNGFQISIVLGVLLAGSGLLIIPILDRFGQPPAVVSRTSLFFGIIMVSLLPALMSVSLKNHGDAMDRPWPAFWIFLGGVLLNIFLNWVLIYGNLGAPRWEMEGAAVATLISRILIVAGMLIWLSQSRDLREWVPFRWLKRPDIPAIRRFLAIGFPASIQMVCEVAAFSAAGLLMGRFGEQAMAAHQIALMCASTSFMVPLGLAIALSVRIGEAAGSKDAHRLRPIVLSGWITSAIWALISAAIFLLAGEKLASWFNDENDVIVLAGRILVVVGIFQLFDCLQVTATSMLRGLHDTRIPALFGFIAYWLIGIPVSVFLAFSIDYGPVGIWWGLAVGLAVACLTLCRRIWIFANPNHRFRSH